MALTGTSPLALPDVEEVRRDARSALDAATAATRALDDAGLVGPSALPGWSRSHVLAHVTAIGEAMARQAELAARGELVEVHDGGAVGREAGIQTGARRTVAEHVAALESLAERLDAAWPAPGSSGWDAPVTYRDGTVADALVAWWREARIHAVDLDAGIGLDTWPRPLGLHLLDFLGVRLTDDVVVEVAEEPARLRVGPGGLRLAAEPGASPHAETPVGSDPGFDAHDGVVVRGRLTDVAAWLAGRTPDAEPDTFRAGEPAPLPEIGPWPSPYSPPR
ncbi:maleylpyruvate isomerase family mycothiol-dependent enzyme [Cellulosimicrobium sp. SH8]|uniref:maleylpyruvate isomerase family mycothiol-dependent enzyme n=1 Tax=Cellulosimicrobium sp. SH8 TaxID=2952936 RepID=UPI0021F3867B|nr:maleylpyruvate isomerase family mycothiol-dependent enzyme [Cellulosimicrobium sp. SH8]